MLRIYDYCHTIADSYFIREGCNIVLFDEKNRSIQKGRGMRLQFLFLHHNKKELKPASRQYKKILHQYEELLARLPLPHRYGFNILQPDTTANMEKQLEKLRNNYTQEP